MIFRHINLYDSTLVIHPYILKIFRPYYWTVPGCHTFCSLAVDRSSFIQLSEVFYMECSPWLMMEPKLEVSNECYKSFNFHV
jgi:hypothetical protein